MRVCIQFKGHDTPVMFDTATPPELEPLISDKIWLLSFRTTGRVIVAQFNMNEVAGWWYEDAELLDPPLTPRSGS